MKKSFFAFSMAVLVGFIAAVTLCVQALNTPQTVGAFGEENMRIVVDAGHGGADGGVSGKTTGVKESDLNLAIAYRVSDVLTDMGFEVTMTRKTEAGLYGTATKGFKKRDMQRRKEIIESVDPMLVLSIHQNRYPARSVRGGQVFYAKESERGKALALSVQAELNELYGKEKVKERKAAVGDYFILNCADCPSVIVECGFLSNPIDEQLLTTEIWQKKLAESIATGVVTYLSGAVA